MDAQHFAVQNLEETKNLFGNHNSLDQQTDGEVVSDLSDILEELQISSSSPEMMSAKVSYLWGTLVRVINEKQMIAGYVPDILEVAGHLVTNEENDGGLAEALPLLILVLREWRNLTNSLKFISSSRVLKITEIVAESFFGNEEGIYSSKCAAIYFQVMTEIIKFRGISHVFSPNHLPGLADHLKAIFKCMSQTLIPDSKLCRAILMDFISMSLDASSDPDILKRSVLVAKAKDVV